MNTIPTIREFRELHQTIQAILTTALEAAHGGVKVVNFDLRPIKIVTNTEVEVAGYYYNSEDKSGYVEFKIRLPVALLDNPNKKAIDMFARKYRKQAKLDLAQYDLELHESRLTELKKSMRGQTKHAKLWQKRCDKLRIRIAKLREG